MINSNTKASTAVVIALCSLVVSAFIWHLLADDIELYKHCQLKPTPITAADLAANGPPKDNWHVLITDFTVKDFNLDSYRGRIRVSCELVPKPQVLHQKRKISVNINVTTRDQAETIPAMNTMDGCVVPGEVHEFVNYVGYDQMRNSILMLCAEVVVLPLFAILLLFGALTGRLKR